MKIHPALMGYLQPLITERGRRPQHFHEKARSAADVTSSSSRAIAYGSIESFTAMVNVAGEVPVDGSTEDARSSRPPRRLV